MLAYDLNGSWWNSRWQLYSSDDKCYKGRGLLDKFVHVHVYPIQTYIHVIVIAKKK